MPSIITAGDASNGLVVASGNDGAVVIQSGLAGAKVAALSIAADGTPTYVAPTGAVAKAVAPIQLGTAVATTSGTSIDFTGIPAGVKRVTVMFKQVSTNGASNMQVQVGSGSISASGYISSTAAINLGTGQGGSTTGLLVANDLPAATNITGFLVLSLFASNQWAASGSCSYSTSVGAMLMSAGLSPALSGQLDRLRLTTQGGTDAFDLGLVNISWEF